MRIVTLSFAALLAGCQTPPSLEQQVWQASNLDLCEAIMMGRGEVVGRATHEAHNRGINCQEYQQAVLHRQQLRLQAAGILMQNRTPPVTYQPIPAPTMIRPPRQINCTSRTIGGTIYTDCQ